MVEWVLVSMCSYVLVCEYFLKFHHMTIFHCYCAFKIFLWAFPRRLCSWSSCVRPLSTFCLIRFNHLFILSPRANTPTDHPIVLTFTSLSRFALDPGYAFNVITETRCSLLTPSQRRFWSSSLYTWPQLFARSTQHLLFYHHILAIRGNCYHCVFRLPWGRRLNWSVF